MGNFNVDELPDLNEKNSKPKAFNVDELPDLKKKDEPNLKSGSNGSSSSNTTSKSESGFSNGKNTTSQVKPVNNMPIEQINDIGNIFQKPTEKKQDIPIPFDAKKVQPIAGTKLPVPEKVDYSVNKEGKDIQGVEWGAFREYEVSQRALSEVDKKLAGANTKTIHINSIGAFTSPVENKQFEQELSKRKEQLTQERNPLKIKADAVLEVTNNQVEKIIDVAKNKYGLDHFSYTNKDGEKVADPTKVEAWAKSIAKKAGLPEDSYAERLLYNQMKAQVDFKPVAEKIDQEVKTIYKSKYGKSFDDLIGDDQKKYFSQFKEGKEIEERFKLQEKSVLEQTIVPRDEQTKQLGELYKQSAESLNAEFESMHSQQSQKAEIAKSLYEKGTLPYETANQQINEAIRQQKALQSDFAKKLEDVTTEYLTNNSYINAKYNKQAKRMIDELAKSADREYRKVAEKYAQGYKIPDSLKKEYESVYKQAYSKVTKSEDERLYEKDKGKLLSFTSSLYNQHFMHGLGGAIKSFSTALGLRSGEILGDNIQSRRSFSNQEIKDASDFVNPVKFIGSAGETIGGMLPMIAGQTTISALTGGMSIPAQMALQGIYGVTTEALQSAGANKDQIFAQTGSVTEANKAFNKTMTGYLALFPLATIDGLPFIEKATLGIKNWAARAGAKSIVETAGETLQETMQNKVDEIATDIKEEDLKSMFDVSKKDFYQSGLNVAPTTLIMGGAPTVFNQGIKEYRTAMGKAYATKNMLAGVSGSAREQFIHGLVTNRGSDFTKAYATALFNNGEISGIELDRLHENIKTAERINQNSEALGLTKPQARVYAAMQFDLENSKNAMFRSIDLTDESAKSAQEQIISEKQKMVSNFLATKKGDYAVVTNADLSQQVLTLGEFDKLAENPEFIKALAGGDVQAFIETDKKGKESKILSDSINAKIKEQNTAKPSTNQQTPTELTVGLSDKEGNKITRISEDGNDIFVQDKDGNIKTYTKDEADKIFGTELLPNPIVNQNQVQDGKEQKAEGQENVLTGTDQKVEPQVQEDKTNTPAPLESLTAEQKKEVAKDVEAKVLKQKAIDGTLDEYLLGLYNEKIQKENENKGTPVEPVDTGQKQDNGTGVQQPQQDDKSIQQGSGTGQNMPDQKEVSGQVQAKEVKTQAGSVVEGDVETYFNENTRSTQDSKYNPDLSGEGEMALLEQENRLLELGADRIQAHGLAKGSIGQQFKDLINILTKGLDSRGGGKLYTAPLVMPTELRAGAGSALGTGGGTAYTDGGFIILAREGVNEIRSIDDIGGVLVNQAVVDSLPELVDRLKKQFPNISIESYSNAPKAIESIKSKAVEEALTPTPEVSKPVSEIAEKGEGKSADVMPTNAWGSKESIDNNFYTKNENGFAVKIPLDRVENVNIDGIDFHVSKVDGDWKVIEKNSGLEVSTGKLSNTKKSAIEDATYRISNNGGANNISTISERAIKQFTDSNLKLIEAPVSKMETTENPALKDVESTAKALEGIDESQLPEVIDKESYLAKNGAPFMGGAEPALHKNIQEGRAKQQMIKRVSDEMNKNNQKREELRKEYEQKVKEGKILPPNRNDKLIASANSNPDLESTQAARRLLEKKGIDWQIGKTKPQSISEAYHKAKADGSNPELVKAVEELLNDNRTSTEVNQPVQQDASTSDKQGNKESVQQSIDATGQGNAEGKTAVLDIERVQNKLNNNEPLNGEEIIIAEQNKLTPQNLDNNIKLAEDENEQQLAESKLTTENNIEQEPNVKAIESKANSNNEVELNEAVQQADGLINNALKVVIVPISEIKTNEGEYQGRKKQFSERSANNVHKHFDKNSFNPIIIYKHPDGNTYVLSGHSRLEGMKRRGEKTIPASYFEGTPQEAKDFALKSNKLGTLQTDIENAAYYREQLNNGKSYNAVLEEAKANEQQGSAKKIVSMAHLNPDGKTMKSLEALEGTEGDSNTNLVSIATKIGDIRAKNPHLTDAHENELFEYMTQDKDNIPTDKELADQNSQINRSINSVRFDNKEPLNLQKFTNKSDARLAWEAEKKDLESQVAELKKEVSPSKKTGWTGLKEKAITSIAKGNTKEQLDQAERDFENDVNGIKANYQKLLEKKRAELTAVSNKLAKHLLSEKNLIEGEKNQGSLFSAGTKPNIKTISKKAFDGLINRLKKAFPNVKVFQDESTLKARLKEFGMDMADFLSVWHGSPYNFDKFSTDKIGTGENAVEIEDKIQFLRTKDGTIYGAKFPDGSIYISPDNLNANTPIHEFGHIWEQAFGARFKAGVEILKQSAKGRALIEQVRNNPFYKKMTQEQIEREALVVAIGNKGEQLFGASNYEKLKQWISDLFKAIKEKLGFKQNLTADETLENFTKGVVGELLGGKVLSEDIGKGGKRVNFSMTLNGKEVMVKDLGVDVVNGFYSPLEKIINETKFEKLPAKQWIDKFAKGDEAKWTGLTDWLAQQQGSVSKADIQQFLKENRIQVVEVVNSGKSEKYYQLVEEQKNASRELDILESDLDNWSDENYKESRDKKYELNDKIKDLSNQIREEESKTKDTKFENYQLEGEKENYKEVLVTMPTENKLPEGWTVRVRDNITEGTKDRPYGVYDPEGKMQYTAPTEARAKALLREYEKTEPTKFQSSHFDEPNILVHLRMNTRTDAEGKKVLFLEELQSDFGQQGKKQGFKVSESDRNKKIELDKKARENGGYKSLTDAENKFYDDYTSGKLGSLKEDAIPQAPFVTDTNAWTKLALKVALKESVKQGADKIAWSTGTQQFERWGSEEIHWKKREQPNTKWFINKNDAHPRPYEVHYKDKMGTGMVERYSTYEQAQKGLSEYENRWVISVNEQKDGATAFAGNEEALRNSRLSEADLVITNKEELRNAIKRNLARERNDAEIDKLTNRVWDRMQKEESGTSLPRKEGMKGFYGSPNVKISGSEVYRLSEKNKSENNEALEDYKKQITSNEYSVIKLPISELIKGDEDLAQFIKDEKVQKGRKVGSPIIIGEKVNDMSPNVKDGVIDGWHRISQALVNGETEIEAYVPTNSKFYKEGSLGIVGNVAKSLFKQEPKTVEIETDKNTMLNESYSEEQPDGQYKIWNGETRKWEYDLSKEIAENRAEKLNEKYVKKNTSTQHSIDITPELRAEVEQGLPLFKFDSTTINDDVREMKAAGLSEDRIREVLALSGNTQEEIDKALSGEGEVFGIKKAMAGEEFIQSHPLSKMSDKEVYEAGKVLVDSGIINPTELIDEVVAGVTKVLTAEQTAALIYHRAQLSNILDLQLSELANAIPQTAEYSFAKQRVDATLIQLENYKMMQIMTAREQSMAFRLRKLIIDSEYSLQEQIAQYKRNNKKDGTIPKDIEDKFIELDKQIKGLQDEVAMLEKQKEAWEQQQAVLNIKNSVTKKTRANTDKKARAKAMIAEGLDDVAQFLGAIMKANGSKMPELNKALVKIGKGFIEAGEATLSDVFEKIKEAVKQRYGNNADVSDYEQDVIGEIKDDYVKSFMKNDELKIPNKLLRNLVANGFDTIETLTEKVKDIISEYIPDVTERQVRDAITKYGKTIEQDKGDISTTLRKIKRIGQLLSKIEDARNNKRPKKTGLVRDEVTPEERAMQQELHELLKTIPLDEAESENLYKTALDKVKKRLENSIEDVKKQLEEGKRIKKTKGIIYDDDANKLLDELNGLRKKLDEKYPKTGVSYEQRLQMAKRAVKNAIEDYERRINSRNFDRHVKKELIPDDELKQQKETLDKLRQEYKALYDASTEAETQKLVNYKKQLDRKKAELERRLDEKDYEPRTKKQSPHDEEIGKKNIEIQKLQDQFEYEQEKNRINNMSGTEWLMDVVLGFLGIPRMLRTTIDLSAPFRQGIRLMAGHPKLFAKAFIKMHKMAFSQKQYDDFMSKLRASKEYSVMLSAGLSITDATGIQRAMEDRYLNNIIGKALESKKLNKKLGGVPSKFNFPFKASERGYTGFVNMMRINVFLQGMQILEKKGVTIENNKEAYKVLAQYVNSATGRGDISSLGKSMQAFNAVFFSPRMLKSMYDYPASILKTMVDGTIPKELKFMMAKDLVSFIGFGIGALSLAAMSYRSYGGDDDDEYIVESDPRSADFGKFKYKNNRYDIWAGYMPLVRTIVQLKTMEQKSIKDGSIKKLDGSSYGGDTGADKLVSFLTNKLAPIPSVLWQRFKGKDNEGNAFEWKNTPKQLLLPMSIEQGYEGYSNDDIETGEAVLNTLLNFYGVGVQRYGDTQTGNKAIKPYGNPYKNNYKNNYKSNYKSNY